MTHNNTNRTPRQIAQAAFRASPGHLVIKQWHLAEQPRFRVIGDDHYAGILEILTKPGRYDGRQNTPVGIELHPQGGVRVTVGKIGQERRQRFSLAALGRPDRILAHFGLVDDDNRIFEQMARAFAEAHGADPDLITRISAELTADYNRQYARRRQAKAKFYRGARAHYEAEKARWEMQQAKTSAAAAIGDDIKRMLGQPDPEPEPEISAEEREAQTARGYEAALRPDPSHRPRYEFKVRYG